MAKEKKIRYKTKTFKTGYFGSQRKINKLVAKGWEVVVTARSGWSGNQITMRKEK